MSDYYFLASYLPRIEIGYQPALGFSELMSLMQVNLSDKDLKKVRKFLQIIDLENFRAIWAGESINPRGNYSEEALKQALQEERWPDGKEFAYYLKDFLDAYKSREDRLRQFPFLISQFLDIEGEKEEGFLAQYFRFEREWRLVLTGFRAKKLGKNIDVELQYEDPADPIVAQILAQKDAKTYEPPFEYKELKPIFEKYEDSPMELQQTLYEYQFQKIIEFQDGEHFSINRILAYLARLLIAEKWNELDVSRGIELIDTIERKIQ